MFINMGRNYELNADGYVYAFGIGEEWGWFEGTVYLCRVPKISIENYDAYEYYAGSDSTGVPIWTASQSEATPLDDVNAIGLCSAMYHEGSRHYIFLSMGGIYVAPNPWGAWTWVRFDENEYNASWQGGYMPGIISKDAGTNYFYFTLAGQDTAIGYFCHIGKIELQLAEVSP